jgi:hypothetical protein
MLQATSEEVVAPHKVQAGVPRDLDTICVKCLEKDPARRYASALDLADDLHRYLDGAPIKARPVGPVQRAVKWLKRRPGLAAASALILVLPLLAASLVWQFRERPRPEKETVTVVSQADSEQRDRYFRLIAQTDQEQQGGNSSVPASFSTTVPPSCAAGNGTTCSD